MCILEGNDAARCDMVVMDPMSLTMLGLVLEVYWDVTDRFCGSSFSTDETIATAAKCFELRTYRRTDREKLRQSLTNCCLT